MDHDPYDSIPPSRAGSIAERRRRWNRARARRAANGGGTGGDDSLDEEAGASDDYDDEYDGEDGSDDGQGEDDEEEEDPEWRKDFDVDPVFGHEHSPSPSRNTSPRRAGSRRVSAQAGPSDQSSGNIPPPQPFVSTGPGREDLLNNRPNYGSVSNRWASSRTITSGNAFGESVKRVQANSSNVFSQNDQSGISEADDEHGDDGHSDGGESTTPTASHISVFTNDGPVHSTPISNRAGNPNDSQPGRKKSTVSLKLPDFGALSPNSERRSRRRSSALGPRDVGEDSMLSPGFRSQMKSIDEGGEYLDGAPVGHKRIRRRSSAVSRRMSIAGVELGKSTSGQTVSVCSSAAGFVNSSGFASGV